MKITNPSRMAHTVATVPEEVSSMAKNSTDWATPENRKRELPLQLFGQDDA